MMPTLGHALEHNARGMRSNPVDEGSAADPVRVRLYHPPLRFAGF
jgi:hypothetical protein